MKDMRVMIQDTRAMILHPDLQASLAPSRACGLATCCTSDREGAARRQLEERWGGEGEAGRTLMSSSSICLAAGLGGRPKQKKSDTCAMTARRATKLGAQT
eukprot:768707-Hanusia_phi.AAC.1